jgi:hypothetical protein
VSPDALVGYLRGQGEYCAAHGSVLYGLLCAALADDVVAGGPAADLLARWTAAGVDRARVDREVPALRLLGGAHRLVLSGRAPGLAAHFPSAGGAAGPQGAWPALRAVLAEHGRRLRAALGRPPQTNEVGRSVPLLGGLRQIAAWTGAMPVRLHEIGTSAGLNLRADHFPVGPGMLLDSPLPLPQVTAGPIVQRVGADLHPLDPTTTRGRLVLASYVWPDDRVRLERLRAALAVAAAVPVQLRRCSAAELVRGLDVRAGAVTVLWHSVMWQYVGEQERTQVLAQVARLGAAASDSAPFAHLRFEPARTGQEDGGGHQVRLTLWPGGADRLLGTAPAHGVPTRWR